MNSITRLHLPVSTVARGLFIPFIHRPVVVPGPVSKGLNYLTTSVPDHFLDEFFSYINERFILLYIMWIFLVIFRIRWVYRLNRAKQLQFSCKGTWVLSEFRADIWRNFIGVKFECLVDWWFISMKRLIHNECLPVLFKFVWLDPKQPVIRYFTLRGMLLKILTPVANCLSTHWSNVDCWIGIHCKL